MHSFISDHRSSLLIEFDSSYSDIFKVDKMGDFYVSPVTLHSEGQICFCGGCLVSYQEGEDLNKNGSLDTERIGSRD